ncbi:hypothetical protein HJ071_10070 [Vibrio parahaemolyticus]|nr:hypothetical protein [Vibrio parahaemolyticus]
MRKLKNHYGENVGWFCYEASLIDADFKHDDLIPDVLEIICDNGGSIDVDVRKLFESAHVAIEEKEQQLEQNENSFFAGLAVALQSLSLWNQKTIADEIVSGLGSEKEKFYSYLENEGGIDAETLEFLKKGRLNMVKKYSEISELPMAIKEIDRLNKINSELMNAINKTIGFVESNNGDEESIRLLRNAIRKVQSNAK